SYIMYGLLVIGGLNTVLSLFYYINVLKVMALDLPLDDIEGREPAPLPLSPGSAVYATVLALVVLVLGILWDPLARASDKGVARFHAPQHAKAPPNRPPGIQMPTTEEPQTQLGL